MKRALDPLLVAGAAFAAYVPNLANGFVYDARFIVECNPLVQRFDLGELLTSGYWHGILDAGLWRPLTLVSFGVNRLLGAEAQLFHVVDDILHAGASVLVLRTARVLGASRFVALASGLVFALHPLQTEAVDSIVGRAELLAFVLALASFLLYVRGRHPVLIGVLFFLALTSKESAAFAVALFLVYALLFERKSLLPLAAAVAAYGALRLAVLGSLGVAGREIGFLDNPLASASLGTRLAASPMLFAKYAGLVLWPDALSADYSYNQIPLEPDLRLALGLALLIGLGALAWTRRGLTAFATLAFIVPLAGFLHILFPLGTLFAERLTYLPMLGAAMLIALGVSALPGRTWVLGILLLAAGARTVSRHPDWRDNETLFRKTVATSPESARSHFLLGAELLEQKRYAEAAEAFEDGLRIAPQHVGARMSLGAARLGAGDPMGAVQAFEEAYRRTLADDIRERLVAASLEAGREKARERDWTGARTYLEQARTLAPDNTEAASSLGLVLEQLGEVDRARALYEETLARHPDDLGAILNLAGLLGSAGDSAGAEALLRRAVALAPNSYAAYNGLGIALQAQGRLNEASAAFRAAVAIDPERTAAREHLKALRRAPKTP